jgi:Zn-dependent protease
LENLVDAVLFYVAFLLSVTLHEAAHAWAAKRGGDETAYLGGQISIDPIPHIRREPIGMLVLPILTVVTMGWPFGYASAPYNAAWAREHPRRAAWMALAGPGANALLLILTAVLIRVGVGMGDLTAPSSVNLTQVVIALDPEAGLAPGVAFLLSAFFTMNLVLLVLNLIPVPPLDGSGALPLLLSKEWGERYRDFCAQPGFGIAGILVAWMLFGEILFPTFLAAVNLLYPELHYG